MAVAIICDTCVEAKAKVENAIELVPGIDGFSEVIYHKLDELEDMPKEYGDTKEKMSRIRPVLN